MRQRALNDRPERPRGDFVLYWMVAHRRAAWNHALDEAVAAARRLGRPLLVLEPLAAGYPWASDRLHAFVLQGMADQAAAFARAGVTYLPYVEPEPGAGKGLLAALAARAALIVTDDWPGFFLPRLQAAAAARLDVRVLAVDSSGLLPVREAGQAFPTAYAFRRHLQRHVGPQLLALPRPRPFAGAKLAGAAEIPAPVLGRWPAATAAQLGALPAALAALPIDHAVPPVAYAGGAAAGHARLAAFVGRLDRYAEDRNHPDLDAGSGLSPYLHFGHTSVFEVFAAVARREGWDPSRLGATTSGQKDGFWGMSPAAEGFLDELVTWRELGLGWAAHRPGDHDKLSSLPEWARKTLAAHAGDRREHVYTRATFEAARTHDPLWNAAQRQLRAEGRIHNYLRMLWGKKILEWTPSPQAALELMIELNDRWAVDGRDPNSTTGILWVLGRHDRPWAPERPVFGTVRWMSSQNTARKLRVKAYLERWGPAPSLCASSSAAGSQRK